MMAADVDHVEIADLLIKNGANVFMVSGVSQCSNLSERAMTAFLLTDQLNLLADFFSSPVPHCSVSSCVDLLHLVFIL